MIPESFHFLRPAWLLALLALAPIAWGFLRRERTAGAWERVCDAHLLRHLVADGGRRAARWPLALLALAWIAACLALAGPTVERLPQTAFRAPGRTVFVLGLADSMNQQDVKPSRLARARHKLVDALDDARADGGSVALVAYKEEGFAVTPLTDDAAVLREAIPLLETRLMPGRTVSPARGLEEARRLLEPQGLRGARVVLVSDGADADPKTTQAVARALADAGVRVSVLSVVPEAPGLEALARSAGGVLATLAIDDTDLARVLAPRDDVDPTRGGALAKSEATTDEWNDLGAWLVWVPLLVAPFAFRRGWAAAVAALFFVQLAAVPARADALDAFQRPDQRGASAFAAGRYAESAQQFEDPAWQGAARYRAGDFAGAAQALATAPDPAASYNLGNALAKAGKLEDAVAAYDRALAAQPDDEDARFNRDLVTKLLEQQKQQKRQQDGEGQQKGESQPQQEQKQEGQQAGGSQAEPQPGQQEAEQGAGEGQEQDPASQQGDPQSGRPGGAEEAKQDAAEAKQGDAADAKPGSTESATRAAAPAAAAEAPEPGAAAGPISAAEQEHAQWMARLPDDPGGLLREKIRRDYLRKQAERRGEDRS